MMTIAHALFWIVVTLIFFILGIKFVMSHWFISILVISTCYFGYLYLVVGA